MNAAVTSARPFAADRILFLKFGAMGDVLMTTPMVRQIRRAYPSARIDYLVARPFAAVLEGNPHVNEVRTFDEKIFTQRQAGPWLGLVRDLRRRRYDLVFVLDKHWSFNLTARLAGIHHRAGYVRDAVSTLLVNFPVPFGGVRHDVLCYLDLARAIGLHPDETDVRMDLRAGDTEQFPVTSHLTGLGEPYFACANSGGLNVRESGGRRRVPDEFFCSLVDQLAKYRRVVLLGSAQDAEYYATLNLPDQCLNLAGRTTLTECAAILRGAEKVYSTECGMLHLAAAAGAKSLCVFFGPTHPQRKAPLTSEVECIWTDASLYDPAYEDRGVPPQAEYFRGLHLDLLKHHFPPAASVQLPSLETQSASGIPNIDRS